MLTYMGYQLIKGAGCITLHILNSHINHFIVVVWCVQLTFE